MKFASNSYKNKKQNKIANENLYRNFWIKITWTLFLIGAAVFDVNPKFSSGDRNLTAYSLPMLFYCIASLAMSLYSTLIIRQSGRFYEY